MSVSPLIVSNMRADLHLTHLCISNTSHIVGTQTFDHSLEAMSFKESVQYSFVPKYSGLQYLLLPLNLCSTIQKLRRKKSLKETVITFQQNDWEHWPIGSSLIPSQTFNGLLSSGSSPFQFYFVLFSNMNLPFLSSLSHTHTLSSLYFSSFVYTILSLRNSISMLF